MIDGSFVYSFADSSQVAYQPAFMYTDSDNLFLNSEVWTLTAANPTPEPASLLCLKDNLGFVAAYRDDTNIVVAVTEWVNATSQFDTSFYPMPYAATNIIPELFYISETNVGLVNHGVSGGYEVRNVELLTGTPTPMATSIASFAELSVCDANNEVYISFLENSGPDNILNIDFAISNDLGAGFTNAVGTSGSYNFGGCAAYDGGLAIFLHNPANQELTIERLNLATETMEAASLIYTGNLQYPKVAALSSTSFMYSFASNNTVKVMKLTKGVVSDYASPLPGTEELGEYISGALVIPSGSGEIYSATMYFESGENHWYVGTLETGVLSHSGGNLGQIAVRFVEDLEDVDDDDDDNDNHDDDEEDTDEDEMYFGPYKFNHNVQISFVYDPPEAEDYDIFEAETSGNTFKFKLKRQHRNGDEEDNDDEDNDDEDGDEDRDHDGIEDADDTEDNWDFSLTLLAVSEDCGEEYSEVITFSVTEDNDTTTFWDKLFDFPNFGIAEFGGWGAALGSGAAVVFFTMKKSKRKKSKVSKAEYDV